MNGKADHIIEVRCTNDGQPVKHDSLSPESVENSVNIKPAKESGQIKTAAITSAIQQTARGIGGFAISSYGDISGDYIGQQQISDTTQLLGMGVLLATGGVAGAIAVGLTVGTKVVQRAINIKKSETISNAKMKRMGIIEGGSR